MKWVKASDRLPEEKAKWYIFRQAGNTRSATTVWLENVEPYDNSIQGYLGLPIKDIEWLDETTPEKGDEWIRVEDGLPKFPDNPYNGFSERVLAFDGSVMKVVSLFKSGNSGLLGYNTQQSDYMNYITHWCKLPLPPTP